MGLEEYRRKRKFDKTPEPAGDVKKKPGKSFVIQSGPEFRILAVNDLGDSNHPSAAVADSRFFLVGLKNLYCVGKK